MRKILIIEDERSIRETIADIVILKGYICRAVDNGEQGVIAAREMLPDLILCDVMMPKLDGHGVLAALQRDVATATIPFIFLTAKVTNSDIRIGMNLGADDYVIKPFTASDLVSAIEKRLMKHDLLKDSADKEVALFRSYLKTALPHELRTPLTGIIGYLELLQSDFERMESDEVHSIFRRLSVSAKRLHDLAEKYVLYGHLSLVVHDPTMVTKLRQYARCFDTVAVIEDAAFQKAVCFKREADLVLELQARPLALESDSLRVVVNELVDNAFKFSKAGTLVTVEGTVTGAFYEIVIHNFGRGMTQQQIHQIDAHVQFERQHFEQGGNGLGLHMARQLAEIFGGSLQVNSIVGESITVAIQIPVIAEMQDRAAAASAWEV